jgi:aminocarboxymuconate-semialdehyde decarboxylase
MGIGWQVVMPPSLQCYNTVPIDVGVKAARGQRRAPDRLIGIGTVPLQDVAKAASKLDRSMHDLGFKGAEILTNVDGCELSDASLEPFWKKAEQIGALIVIHPNGFTDAKRLSRFYFNNIIGNPLETAIALHYLIFDGVLERHPNLKIRAARGGGYLGG